MNKTPIYLGLLSASLALFSCSTTSKVSTIIKKESLNPISEAKTKSYEERGINLSFMDTQARAQDNFYDYVNGGWMKKTVIPADKASWGSFNELRESTDNKCLDILNGFLTREFETGSEGQKIKDLYATFMDMNQRNADGIKPIMSDIASIDTIKNIRDLHTYLKNETPNGGNEFYDFYVYTDLKSSKENAIYLGGPSLGLGKDYYQKQTSENQKTLEQYTQYISKIMEILGYKNTYTIAKNIVDLEKKLAKNLLSLEQGRNAELRYNPKSLSELKQLVKSVDLPNYLKSNGITTNRVILNELKYVQNLDQILTEDYLDVIKNYLKFHLINENASNLNANLDELHFDFYNRTLQGQKEQRALNKRALATINGVLGEAFGKLYVEENFPAEAKNQMLEMVSYLKEAYKIHIENLEWMSPTTKTKALEKLSKFTVKIGYPDKWKDYSKLQINPKEQGATFYSNLKNVKLWNFQKKMERIGKPVDKIEWGMTPQTVNAYYSPQNNEIVFPAAILQAPFFDFKADPAVNFGGIGAVIGHEISHGFDDSGSRFDGDGNLKNWWTDQDKANFEKATNQLAAQYNNYEPVKGTFVNGKFTLGENIADLGGVSIAFDALNSYLKNKGTIASISNFTQQQRFFMSWATIWRTKSTEKYMINLTKTDAHSPGYFRAFGPLVNLNSFYEVFDIKPSDKLYVAPEKRIKIW